MAIPTVAIIGRPNVGKSSLLNALAGEMISIVEPTAGVTRDRVSTFIEINDRYIELIDTGGYGIVDEQDLGDHIESQIQRAIETADLIIFMVDVRDGLTPLDKTIAKLLRKQGMKVIPVANKADSGNLFHLAADFSKLGFGEFLCISALNNLNKKVLLEKVYEEIKHSEEEKPQTPVMNIAIVGKRNAGKSTLVNAIVGEDRVIVNELPGTTRDAVDVRFEKEGRVINIIDTAGLRKKSSLQNSIEFYSYVRATKSVKRADVVLFLIDAVLPISRVDKKLSKFIIDEFKSCILVINKWDLAKEKAETGDFEEYLTEQLPSLRNVPIAFTTATDGKNVQSLMDLTNEIFKQTTTWIPTPKLNKAIEILKNEPVTVKRTKFGKPKIYYATQVAANPVTFLLFVNRPQAFDQQYLRFVKNRLQELLPIGEVPVRLLIRAHRKKEKR